MPEPISDGFEVVVRWVADRGSSIDERTSRFPRLLARVVLRLAAPLVSTRGDHITDPVAEKAVDSAAAVTSSVVLGYLLVWYLDSVAGYAVPNVAYGVVVSGFGSLFIGIASVSGVRREVRSDRLRLRASQSVMLWGTEPGVDLDGLLTPTERRSQRIERSVVLSVGFVVFVLGFLLQVLILAIPPASAEILGTTGPLVGRSLSDTLLLVAVLLSVTTLRLEEIAGALTAVLVVLAPTAIVLFVVETAFGSRVAGLFGLSVVLLLTTVWAGFLVYQAYLFAGGLARRLRTPLRYER